MQSNDTVSVKFTVAQARLALAAVDSDISALKNCLVSATLAKGDYRDQAVPLAKSVEEHTQVRAAIVRAVHDTFDVWI